VLTDTYTRKSEYAKAQDAVERSRRDGFLLPQWLSPRCAWRGRSARGERMHARGGGHGITTTRTRACPGRSRSPAAGPGARSRASRELIQHSRDYPVDRNIHNQQYIDRLAAALHRERHPDPAARVGEPAWLGLPRFKVTVSLLEVLLSAAQGVKHIDLSLGIGMNLVQDAAAIQSLRSLAREFLDRLGHQDVKIYSWTYFFLGDWPLKRGQMVGQLAWNAAVSALGGACGMYIKVAR
jgi:glutamate mutase epsilon subunit